MSNNKEVFRKIALFGSVILISLVFTFYSKWFKNQPQDYAIGTIDKIWKPVKGGRLVSYTYELDGKTYEGNVDYLGYEEVAVPGKRFIVQFAEGYYSSGLMLLDCPVPDGIEAPRKGWKDKPEF